MGSRRDQLEVIADILRAALKGASKTRIMYRANLNFSRVNRYLAELLEMGLVSLEKAPGGGTIYRTTEDGKTFLRIVMRKGRRSALKLRYGPSRL